MYKNLKMITPETIAKGISYQTYLALTEQLLTEGKTTGPNQSKEYVHYTELNFHRMKRIFKTIHILPDLEQVTKSISNKMTWIILTEAWCGDAAQNIPVIEKIAALNHKIEVIYLLRDENLELMDQYLTNGGRSIPKLIALDAETNEEVFTWGPRPAAIQKVMDQLKADGFAEISKIVEEIQKAYNEDKTVSVQKEMLHLLKNTTHAKLH